MPKFQKRHYEFLADWLGNASMALYRHTDRVLVAHSLADRLARDNPRFNRERFLRAARATGDGHREPVRLAAE